MNKQEKIIELARSLIGKPYKYGVKAEEAPDFFDCSLLTHYVFGKVGIEISRSTIEQAASGEQIELDNLEPGDLIFMHGRFGHYSPTFPEGVGHVGIYTDSNTVIHATSKRVNLKPIVEVGSVIESTLDEYIEGWEPIVIIRRYIV